MLSQSDHILYHKLVKGRFGLHAIVQVWGAYLCKCCVKKFTTPVWGEEKWDFLKTRKPSKSRIPYSTAPTAFFRANLPSPSFGSRKHKETNNGNKISDHGSQSKSDASRKELSADVTVHEQKKSFKCNICHINFTEKVNMNKHIASVHENKILFEFKICGTKFNQKSALNVHIKSIHECYKSFDTKKTTSQLFIKERNHWR